MTPRKTAADQPKKPAQEDTGNFSLISRDDLHLFNEGRHFRLYDKLGAHLQTNGTYFAVWAYQVNPQQVSVGDPIDLSKRLDGSLTVRFS